MSGLSDQAYEAARTAALRALAVRPRSVVELRRRLRGRFEEPAVAQVLQRLEQQGLLDDTRFAQEWRRSREQSRPRSALLVRRELLQRGVNYDVADAAVEGMDDEEAAQRAARGHLRHLRHLDQSHADRRMWAYLQRRGFSSGVTQRTMRLLAQEEASPLGGGELTRLSPDRPR